MKKILIFLVLTFLLANIVSAANLMPLYRFYNPDINDHFYTTSEYEKDLVMTEGKYLYEWIIGYVYESPQPNTVPIHRLVSPNDHFYTTNEHEKNQVVANEFYQYERIIGYIYPSQQQDTSPLYRLYTPGNHFYTTNKEEKDNTVQRFNYQYEGVIGYLYLTPPKCTDSDGGKNYLVKGQTYGLTNTGITIKEDFCEDKKLTEYYCKDGISIDSEIKDCPDNCENGICVKKALCTDSDGGNNYYIAGKAEEISGKGTFDGCDFSTNPNGILMEAVCQGDNAIHNKIICPTSTPYCNRAICSTEPPKCTDTDNGKNIYLKGTITEPRLVDGPQHTDYCQNMDTKQPAIDENEKEFCTGENCGIREYYCTNPYRTTTYQDIACPQGCKDGACIKRLYTTNVTEQVKCYFEGSTIIQKCYPAGGDIECSGIESCTIEISDEDSKQIVWKSSCGGYAYTTMDRQDEEIFFECHEQLECDLSDILDEGETKVYTIKNKEYETTASYISSSEVKLKINGELTDSMKEKEIYQLVDHTYIQIIDIMGQNLAGEIDRVKFCFQNKQTCKDSDGGKNYFERGITIYTIDGQKEHKSIEICTYKDKGPTTGEIGDSVIESWCELNDYRVKEHYCERGCVAGACLESSIDIIPLCGNARCDADECISCPNDCSAIQCTPLPSECSGCKKDSICLPFGTRIMDGVPKYCELNKELLIQKEKDSTCMNNYECKTNTCVDEKCYSIKQEVEAISIELEKTQSLLQQMMDWIRDWFEK